MDIQRYSDSLKLFINNYQVVNQTLINNNLQIKIWNNKKVRLNLIGRYINFFRIINHKGYNIYNNKLIFSIVKKLMK